MAEQDLRIRRDIREVGARELPRLVMALDGLRKREEFMTLADAQGHGRGGLGTPLFLPWNRALLYRVDQLLPPDLALPVWDWTDDAGIPHAFAGGPLASGPIPESVAASRPVVGMGDVTERNPGPVGALPTADDVAGALAVTDWVTFAEALETLSGSVHVWVGGAMGQVSTSPYDPLFWAHRAMVDRLWFEWQQRHGEAGPPESLHGETLAPLGLQVKDVLDVRALGYAYERLPLAAAERALFESGATNDRPGGLDSMGFQAYATAFAELIAAPGTTPPLTIGIFASWGMGKSTLMQGIKTELERGQGDEVREPDQDAEGEPLPPYVHVVEFNAWDYGEEEAIWPALARSVMTEVYDRLPWPRRARLWRVFRRNLRREWRLNSGRIVVTVALLLLLALIAVAGLGFEFKPIAYGLGGLGLLGFLKVVTDTVANPAGKWVGRLVQGSGYGERLGHIDEIRDDLSFLIDQFGVHSDRDRRVLVLIDDLDRCEPSKTVEVLHAINRLLDFSCFIVCVAADARVVTAVVEKHYEGIFGVAGTTGFEYLDKIVQIPFRIPQPDEDALKSFLADLLPTGEPARAEPAADGDAGLEDVHVVGPGGSAAGAAYEAQRLTLEQKAPLGLRVPFTPDESKAFDRAVPYLRPNPRHVKRLVNVYRLVRTVAEWRARMLGGDPDAELVLENPEATIRWLVASTQWPYTTTGMLSALRRIEREREEAPDAAPTPPEDDELTWLLGQTKLTADNQTLFDDEISELERLLNETRIGLDALGAIGAYSANFNPAVERQLRAEWLKLTASGARARRPREPA